MQEFARYLMKHLVLDFDGDIDMESINELLIEDGSPQALALRTRLLAEGGPNDFLLVLADCLKDYLGEGIKEDHVNEQIQVYLSA